MTEDNELHRLRAEKEDLLDEIAEQHRQSIDDENLLRQALDALQDGGFVQLGPHAWERRDALAIAVLKKRLGK